MSFLFLQLLVDCRFLGKDVVLLIRIRGFMSQGPEFKLLLKRDIACKSRY